MFQEHCGTQASIFKLSVFNFYSCSYCVKFYLHLLFISIYNLSQIIDIYPTKTWCTTRVPSMMKNLSEFHSPCSYTETLKNTQKAGLLFRAATPYIWTTAALIFLFHYTNQFPVFSQIITFFFLSFLHALLKHHQQQTCESWEKIMSRTCSQCGNNGHNSRTCTDASGGGCGGPTAENGIMLFGVRVTEGNAFRKSASMNNLSQYEQPLQADSNAEAGYASDDVVHASGHRRERRRGM